VTVRCIFYVKIREHNHCELRTAYYLSLLQISTGTESAITAAKLADKDHNAKNADFFIFNIYIRSVYNNLTSRALDSINKQHNNRYKKKVRA